MGVCGLEQVQDVLCYADEMKFFTLVGLPERHWEKTFW